MKPPVSTTARRLDHVGKRVHTRRTCRCRLCRTARSRFGYACRPSAIARLKGQISRLCDMVQRFSTVLPPEQCFQSSLAAAAVVSHVSICPPSRLSVASCSRQATCSTVQLLLLTADAIAETPASAELPRHVEAPLTPVEHLDASSWRNRRAVHCESEASMVLRMLDLNTRALESDNLAGCRATCSGQTATVRQFKWYRGCGGPAAGNRPRPHRQQQKYRVTRCSQPQQQQQQQQQQCFMPLQPAAAAAAGWTSVGTTWDLDPSAHPAQSSDMTYTNSLKQEPMLTCTDQRCEAATAGNTGPKTPDSAFFTCSSNLTVPAQHHALQAASSCASADCMYADSASPDNSPSRRILRKHCTAMTDRLRSALVSAEVIPSRIRELLCEAVDLVAAPPGVAGIIHQDCRVSVDTLNCVDIGDAARTWDMIACDTPLQASPVAVTCSMGDCSRGGAPVQAVQQQQQAVLEWDRRVEASQQNAVSRRHHDRRQRQLFKLVRRRRETVNTLD